MLECNKRQKIVKKDSTIHRCINRESEANGKEVTESICALCPVRSFRIKPPCKTLKEQKPIPPKEVLEEDTSELEKEMPDPEVPDYPKLSMQLWLYKEALLKWQRAGRPTRSDQEVESLLNVFCKKCDWYDKEKERCKGCGCVITTGSVAIFNKLRMATEHCPRNLW